MQITNILQTESFGQGWNWWKYFYQMWIEKTSSAFYSLSIGFLEQESEHWESPHIAVSLAEGQHTYYEAEVVGIKTQGDEDIAQTFVLKQLKV